MTNNLHTQILQLIPHSAPFRFIDSIITVQQTHIVGTYHLQPSLDFYKGHFAHYPITPGVILTEIAAQIGLVAFGIYLSKAYEITAPTPAVTLLTDCNLKYKLPVPPNTTITVTSTKLLYAHNRLKCSVILHNQLQQVVCTGTLGGMVLNTLIIPHIG